MKSNRKRILTSDAVRCNAYMSYEWWLPCHSFISLLQYINISNKIKKMSISAKSFHNPKGTIFANYRNIECDEMERIKIMSF